MPSPTFSGCWPCLPWSGFLCCSRLPPASSAVPGRMARTHSSGWSSTVRALGEDKRNSRMTVWVIADVTPEFERQENVFQELQHAIDYLDHAPAGFFSVDANGDIAYFNATLAEWLEQDLARVGSGALK